MKTSPFSGFRALTNFARLSLGGFVACAFLSCTLPATAADNAKVQAVPTTTVHKIEEAPPSTDNAITVSPGTGTFQGLIPPAGSSVVNPPHAADKSTSPAPTPTTTVRYGGDKPDGEDTHPPLNLTADRAELVRLDTDAASVIVGNPENVNIQMENRKLMVLTPAKSGATYMTILDDSGKVVMQRHIIVSSPKNNYIRIRRSCNGNMKNCAQTTVYYCPGMCHAVGGEAIGATTVSSASGNSEDKDAKDGNTTATEGGAPATPPAPQTTTAPPAPSPGY